MKTTTDTNDQGEANLMGQNREHRIRHNGFTSLVESNGIFLCTVMRPNGIGLRFDVHMRHGSPAGAFWKNEAPIRSCETRQEANELIDQLAGLTGAHKYFPGYDQTPKW